MKKNLIATLFTSAVILAANNAFAADGTVHFNGAITTEVCNVDPAPGSALTVNLGSVSRASMEGAKGNVSSLQQFQIVLKDCPVSVLGKPAHVRFDGNADNGDSNVLALTQVSGVATGVGVQLVNQTVSNTILPLYQSSDSLTLAAGNNYFKFGARYVSTQSTVVAGVANSSATFTVVYD
ncbi:fimbrial protein [Enterobacillus tribolii]|uniref:Major type 1 subunit fimbrin (Pilin) n=1 Tax=Enterobacillus tribolii TaxID=1487935 RepID=A0A370QHE3_9GAMM|nr:fimbrial protein [Enterobacillus tribolii]MBW7982498.1 type 1 fimbrial protein [Enterobacillus tribolii]RDK87775.1 major type 1 subunit fimbrin (pilin) [Enterobacillus tribolii]